jgi:hypothetical protein
VPAVRTKVWQTPANVAAAPGVISPQASAVATAFIARDTFCGEGSSISPLPTAAGDGRETVTGASRHRGERRLDEIGDAEASDDCDPQTAPAEAAAATSSKGPYSTWRINSPADFLQMQDAESRRAIHG